MRKNRTDWKFSLLYAGGIAMLALKIITSIIESFFIIVLTAQMAVEIINKKNALGTATIVLVYILSIVCMWS